MSKRIMAASKPTIIRVMNDPAFLGNFFRGNSWDTWRIFLKGLFGLSFSSAEAQVFQQFTGRTCPPSVAREGWVIVGRRGGKSAIAALKALFLAAFRDYTPYLRPGEYAVLMTIASDRPQANIVRGYSLAAVIADELTFWRDERYSNPDTEILNALRPGMATIPGSLLLCISSPYSRTGELWRACRRYYGQPDDEVLVWKATSRQMNPTLPEKIVRDALERDPAAARAEYLGEFRTDVESLISLETSEDVTVNGRRELPCLHKVGYFAFVDPSGGSHDSFTLAISHRENKVAVLGALRERKPPFNPENVVREFAQLLKAYRINRVMGDRYAGQWC